MKIMWRGNDEGELLTEIGKLFYDVCAKVNQKINKVFFFKLV